MKRFVVPILVIALGVAWLLNVKNILPEVNWIWTIGLGVSGVVLLVIEKINKFNFLVGVFLIIASVFSILRQTGKINPNVEVPTLCIIFGILMLIVQILNLQNPSWMIDDKKLKKKTNDLQS